MYGLCRTQLETADEPDWMMILHSLKKIAMVVRFRPSDVHQSQLKAALQKQQGYKPLIEALALAGYESQDWIIYVFPLAAGISGLVYLHHIYTLQRFFESPSKHYKSAIQQSTLASVRSFHFLHQVRFGGPSFNQMELTDPRSGGYAS